MLWKRKLTDLFQNNLKVSERGLRTRDSFQNKKVRERGLRMNIGTTWGWFHRSIWTLTHGRAVGRVTTVSRMMRIWWCRLSRSLPSPKKWLMQCWTSFSSNRWRAMRKSWAPGNSCLSWNLRGVDSTCVDARFHQLYKSVKSVYGFPFLPVS